jgi:hypothetical protein
MQWFSPETFPQGDDQGYKFITAYQYPKGTGEYYDHIELATNTYYGMFPPGRDDAIESLKAIRAPLKDALYIDEVQVPGEEKDESAKEKEKKEESKIFRSKDGSKILVERKDINRIIKMLKSSRRK